MVWKRYSGKIRFIFEGLKQHWLTFKQTRTQAHIYTRTVKYQQACVLYVLVSKTKCDCRFTKKENSRITRSPFAACVCAYVSVCKFACEMFVGLCGLQVLLLQSSSLSCAEHRAVCLCCFPFVPSTTIDPLPPPPPNPHHVHTHTITLLSTCHILPCGDWRNIYRSCLITLKEMFQWGLQSQVILFNSIVSLRQWLINYCSFYCIRRERNWTWGAVQPEWAACSTVIKLHISAAKKKHIFIPLYSFFFWTNMEKKNNCNFYGWRIFLHDKLSL